MQPFTVGPLFTRYIHLRQSGQSMDDVVKALQDAAYQLPRDERRQLGELVMEWEEKYGAQPHSAPVSATPLPAPAPLKTREPVITPPPVQSGSHEQPAQLPVPAPFGTKFLDPSKLDDVIRPLETVNCPHCGKPTPKNSQICRSCGQSLQTKATALTRRFDETSARKPTQDPAYFAQDWTLVISIRGAKGALEAMPRKPITIGRPDPQNRVQVSLDLTPYNGEALGVSRVHAEIRSQNNTITLRDLESDNGTFVNEVRLYPHEIRVLRHGDDLRFGKLTIKVTFKHN